MHEIKIYGDISHISNKVENEVDLSDLQSQLSEAKGQDIKVRINCDGGDVEEGFAFYYELRRYAKDNNATVHTFAEGRLKSIATIIFLAGDVRELSSGLQPFVHGVSFANGETPNEEQMVIIKALELRIATHYANHTDLTVEDALELMANETYIDTDLAKEMRFATNIENVFVPVALKRFSTNTNNKQMNKRTEAILNKVAKLFGSFQNKLVTSADGKELDFYELADDAVVAVGDKAYYDGMDADGSFIMPDGETYVFVAGELTEIQSVDMTDTNAQALEEANAAIALLTEKLEAVSNKAVELDTQNKANIALIAGYKASSKSAPTSNKQAPKNVEVEKPSKLSGAIANLNRQKTK